MVNITKSMEYKVEEMVCCGGSIPETKPRDNEKIVHTFEEWDPDGKWDWDHCPYIEPYGSNYPMMHIPREWVKDILQRVGMSVFKERRFRKKVDVIGHKLKRGMLSRKKFLKQMEEQLEDPGEDYIPKIFRHVIMANEE